MSVSCPDECFKIDMGCNCPPPPPDKPLPFMFIIHNTDVVDYASLFATHPSNPGKVGISDGATTLPVYTSAPVNGTNNFAHTLPITIAAPPGFPGPGLTQATATMTVSSSGAVTITMTNTGAGYTTGTGITPVIHTYGNYFNTLHVKPAAATVLQGMGAPVGRLSLPVPFGANMTVLSAKVMPQINGFIENTLSGGSPITVLGKWYKNGVQIGDTQQKIISVEGKHPWTHYCTSTTFTSTDTLSYKLSAGGSTELVNFTGIGEYFIQYV